MRGKRQHHQLKGGTSLSGSNGGCTKWLQKTGEVAESESSLWRNELCVKPLKQAVYGYGEKENRRGKREKENGSDLLFLWGPGDRPRYKIKLEVGLKGGVHEINRC